MVVVVVSGVDELLLMLLLALTEGEFHTEFRRRGCVSSSRDVFLELTQEDWERREKGGEGKEREGRKGGGGRMRCEKREDFIILIKTKPLWE